MTDAPGTRWRLIERLYHEAIGRDAAARDAFLADACRDDNALRREVQSLLGYADAADRFLERPALAAAAKDFEPDVRPPLTGRRIGGYEVSALLGAGGMGEVYRARDVRLGREVALKVLGPAIAADPAYLRRFEEEARSASVLNHPNIVTVYGVGEEGDIAFIAMELVEGQTLRERASAAPMPIATVLDLAVQLASALAAAHARGIVHRDLKPENIMVTPDGLAKILDFGIAKRGSVTDLASPAGAGDDTRTGYTEAGAIIGTVGYMSPEQATGLPAGFPSDQFSFGAILYELVAGRRAFERSTRMETLATIINVQPDPARTFNPDVTAPLQAVLDRCLAKNPAARYAQTRDLELELRQVREAWTRGRQPAGRRRVEPTASGRAARRRVLVVALALAVITVGAVAAWWVWPPRSLGVLVFANSAKDEEAEYLCLGITESLIQRLGALPIAVKPMSLVANLRDSTDPRAAGRQLGVQTILTGSVTRRPGGLAISATLIDVASGASLWTHTYDRASADIFALWNDIATAIVDDGLHLRMTRAERRELTRSPTDSPEAFDLFLRARPLQMGTTEAEYNAARRFLDEAVAKDQKFAEAWVALAATYFTATLDNFMRPIEAWPQVDVYLGKAQALNADLLDLHAGTAARNFYFSWDPQSAEREWQAAFKARDSNVQPELLLMYAMERWALGHPDESLTLARRARAMDPLSPVFAIAEAHYLHVTGRLTESASLYQQLVTQHPDEPEPYFDLADVLADEGRFDQAIAARTRGHELDRDDRNEEFSDLLASAKGEAGYHQLALGAVRLIEIPGLEARIRDGGYASPLDFARAYARLGQTDRSIRYLDEAWTDRAPGLLFLNVDRAWDPVRRDPRFQAYVKKVKEQTRQ